MEGVCKMSKYERLSGIYTLPPSFLGVQLVRACLVFRCVGGGALVGPGLSLVSGLSCLSDSGF